MTSHYKRVSVWKVFGYWAFWIGVLFFMLYPLSNWFTAQREDIYHLYLSSELAIPFIPEFIWIYSSFYLLFILPPFFLDEQRLVRLGKVLVWGTVLSALLFLLFPAELGFERVVPEGVYAHLYETLFSIDHPHNMAPSLHVIYSAAIIYAVFEATRSLWVRVAVTLWLFLISLSTLFVHQHHLIDVVLGLVIVFLLYYFIPNRK